jgi:hypothetical protein
VLVGNGLDFRMGRSLKLKAVPHNRLLLSLAHGMGHRLERFGNSDYCGGGPLSELTRFTEMVSRRSQSRAREARLCEPPARSDEAQGTDSLMVDGSTEGPASRSAWTRTLSVSGGSSLPRWTVTLILIVPVQMNRLPMSGSVRGLPSG